jgi:hypothetical protein
MRNKNKIIEMPLKEDLLLGNDTVNIIFGIGSKIINN